MSDTNLIKQTELYLTKIDCGAFSDIYEINKNSKNSLLIKIDNIHLKKINDYSKLCLKITKNETNALSEFIILNQLNCDYIIKVYFGYMTESLEYILGLEKCLFNLKQFRNIYQKENNIKYFSKDIFNNIIDNTLSGLEYLYKHGLCHRDIKPENILVKKVNDKFIYVLCDFNTTVFFKKNNKMMCFGRYPQDKIIGTLPYVSLNTLLHCLPFPKDDVISLFLSLLHMSSLIEDESIFDDQDESLHRLFLLNLDQLSMNYLNKLSCFDDLDFKKINELFKIDLDIEDI